MGTQGQGDARLEARLRQLHEAACRKGRKTYRDPVTKARVCTSAFLLSRGFCCGCDCRHCPFPAEAALSPSVPRGPAA